MKNLFPRCLLLCFIISILIGCGAAKVTHVLSQEEEKEMVEEPNFTVSDPIPLAWINYEGEKYVFNRVMSKGGVDISKVFSTGTLTKTGDGAEKGKEILLYEFDGSLFIIDNSGPTEEWVNFVKSK